MTKTNVKSSTRGIKSGMTVKSKKFDTSDKQVKWKTEEDGRTKTFVVRKIGNWDIGLIKYSGNPRTFLMVRGLDYGENPIIYSHIKQVGYDCPSRIPDSVKTYIFNNAGKLFDIEKKENNKTLFASRYADREWK